MSKVDKLINDAKKKLKNEILEIENRTDISNDEKANRIIKTISTTCAAIAIQPIPFQDVFILTPIQAYMGTRIAAIRGVPTSKAEITEIIKEIAGVAGMGLLAQQLVLGAYKVGLPGLGGFMSIPVVYGMTFAIGKVMDEYLISKSKNKTFDPETLKSSWKEWLEKGKSEGKKIKKDIIKSVKKNENQS